MIRDSVFADKNNSVLADLPSLGELLLALLPVLLPPVLRRVVEAGGRGGAGEVEQCKCYKQE